MPLREENGIYGKEHTNGVWEQEKTGFKFSSVAQSCPILWPHGLQHTRFPCPSPTPRVYSNSCPLSRWCLSTISSSSPSPPAFNLSQHQGLFQWVSSSHQGPKYGNFSFSISPSNEYSGLISFRMDCLDLLAVQGSLKSLLQHHSSKTSIFLALSFLCSSTLISIHDYWKNHSLD